MPRSLRVAPGGMVFHALNRRVDGGEIFRCDDDYVAFEKALEEALSYVPMRICAYCLMPNHWHMVLWPECDGELSRFVHRFSSTHTARWKTHNDAWGDGYLYQSRFKSFPVQSDEYYITVVRYVERNALRANLVGRAEQWQFSSLWRRSKRPVVQDSLLSQGPLELPDDWVEYVNRPQTDAELEAVRTAIRRGNPFGAERWKKETARKLGLESSLRSRGRPRRSSR